MLLNSWKRSLENFFRRQRPSRRPTRVRSENLDWVGYLGEMWISAFGMTQRRRSRHRRQRQGIEVLEVRALLSTFTVTNTGDDTGPGSGTLRQAILESNANPGPDTINFNIGPAGVHTINLAS